MSKTDVIGGSDPALIEQAEPGALIPIYCTIGKFREVVFRRNNEQGDEVRMVARSAKEGRAVKAEVQGPLDKMLAQGTISADERDAGRQFQDKFHRAGYDSNYATVDLYGIRAGKNDGSGNISARDAVHKALILLHASDSHPQGWPHLASWAWFVLGCGDMQREWVSKRKASGYRMDKNKATGVACCVLNILNVEYKKWAL